MKFENEIICSVFLERQASRASPRPSASGHGRPVKDKKIQCYKRGNFISPPCIYRKYLDKNIFGIVLKCRTFRIQ